MESVKKSRNSQRKLSLFIVKTTANQKLDDNEKTQELMCPIPNKFKEHAVLDEPLTESLQIATVLERL